MKYILIYTLFSLFVASNCNAQHKKTTEQIGNIQSEVDRIPFEANNISSSHRPNSIVRTIKQDRKGNIWMASWEGVFRYDGKSFANVTNKVSSARFFSVLEDKKGNFWFASISSGVYHYDGKSLRNFTSKDGLASDRVTTIYEDRFGHIWFGSDNGVSRYDGKSFQNFKMNKGTVPTTTDSVHISVYQQQLPENHPMHNDVNAIIEDKSGKLWFGTRGYACIYDGKTFTVVTNKDGKPFANVRSIIKDRKGNIWLGGHDGLWRYDGRTFTNFTKNFVGYIYEDKGGNILTSSESADKKSWVLSRYAEKSLSNGYPTVTEIANKPMIFGISEDDKHHIWFGSLDGVYVYDGKIITNLNGK
ncbi:two-component regulator propeller domain-containing protein [Sphingobacterium sp. BIGb0165]|uniref:ligand-binding sensor domain-containing protein n=1 Tax=Sphingobacterium sp. BIGb0165 TaxID=2940615 RepID=UPI002169DE57|nr:two-component regulator propeller domain-containing protein [Sphingobacterium sp. BIGb0165]MCS4224138.1 ligand-binding sensor domain-containing protein [Sphingobacterium sp. BIGb0165]